MLVFDFLHLVGGRLGRYGLLPMQTMRSNQIPALHTGRQGQPRGVRRRVMTTFLLFWLSSALLGVSMPALYAAPQPSGQGTRIWM